MAMSKQEFLELEGNVRKLWSAQFHDNDTHLAPLYNMINKKSGQFTDHTIGAAGRMKKWDGSVSYDTFAKGYPKQYRVEKYSTGIQIDRDMWEDEEFHRLKPYINEVSDAVVTTLRYDGVKIFNGAFSTEIVGPDGKALCATDHTTIPGAPAQSNLIALDLNYTGVEAASLLMEHWVNDRGDEMLKQGNMVIAGPHQRKNCEKLFGSDKEAYVGDNTKNVYKDMKYFIHPLIKGNRWFLANEAAMKGGAGLNFWIRRDPRKLERDGSTALGDFNTEKLSWKSVGRWDYGWTNWFFIVGSNV